MDVDKLRELLAEAEDGEKDALHRLGVCRGYQEAMRDVLRGRESDRKVVEVAGRPVVTAARDPKTEKR